MSDLFGPGSITEAVRNSEFDLADWLAEPEFSGPISYNPERYDEYPGWEQQADGLLEELRHAAANASNAIRAFLAMYDVGEANAQDADGLRLANETLQKAGA